MTNTDYYDAKFKSVHLNGVRDKANVKNSTKVEAQQLSPLNGRNIDQSHK